jgi:hypothetical protein
MKNVKPEDMFSTGPDASLYSKYDNDGIPTHTTDGEPLSKSQFKKLKKDWDKQKKLYEQVHTYIHTYMYYSMYKHTTVQLDFNRCRRFGLKLVDICLISVDWVLLCSVLVH